MVMITTIRARRLSVGRYGVQARETEGAPADEVGYEWKVEAEASEV